MRGFSFLFLLPLVCLDPPCLSQAPPVRPAPKRWLAGPAFSLSRTYRVETPGSGLPAGDPGWALLEKALAGKGCKRAGGASFGIELSLFPGPASLDAKLRSLGCHERMPARKEAFFLHLGKGGARAGSLSSRGLYYALLALAGWIRESPGREIRGGWVLDWPSLEHRAYMLDMGRLVERKEFYRKVLRFLSRRRFNTFVLHLTDDPASALRFPRHPESADPHAWTPGEMKAFVELAGKWHVTLIPEVELFGHAGCWVRRPAYASLAEPGLPTFSPHRPGTYGLIRDLVGAAARIFPSPFFHAGLDEVSGPSSGEGKAFARKWGKGAWLAAHIVRVHDLLADADKRMIMWGDMLLRYPRGAGRIPRDTLIYDWHYGTSFLRPGARKRKSLPPESWVWFREMGFSVVAAPALMNGPYRLWPDRDRLSNTLGTARLAARYGLRGVCVTQWLPQRYLPDSSWFALALAGDACWSGTAFDESRARRAFFRDFFGLEMEKKDLEAIRFLLDRSPLQEDLERLLWFERKGVDRFLARGGYRIRGCLKEAESALARLEGLSKKASRHEPEFGEILRVARVIRHLAWREARGKAILLDPAAEALRKECRKRTAEILREIRDSWRRWRYLDNRNHHDPYAARDDLLADFEKAMVALAGLLMKRPPR